MNRTLIAETEEGLILAEEALDIARLVHKRCRPRPDRPYAIDIPKNLPDTVRAQLEAIPGVTLTD